MAVVVVPMVVMVVVMVDGVGVIVVVVRMVPVYVVIVTGLGRMGVVAMAVLSMACIPLVAVQAQQQGRRHLAPGHG